MTDVNGIFSLEFAAGAEYTLLFTKEGYANQIKAVKSPQNGGSVTHDVTMIPRGTAQTLANESSVTVSGNDGAKVTLNPQFVDEDGNEVSAADGVTLTVTPVDVTSPAGLSIFPGDFAGVAENTTEPTPIISYGTVEFHFTRDSDGKELQLAPGNTAQIELPIYSSKHPDGTNVAIGDSIALWSLNEKTGVWLQEGTGTVVAASSPSGFALSATVSHFTWWNADVAMNQQAEVDIRVNAPAVGTALIKTRTNANIPWGFNQSDTVVAVGASTGTLAIPSDVEVCFWAEVSFDSIASVLSTPESCITAGAGTSNSVTLAILNNTPLNISTTNTHISRIINSSIGEIKLQATTLESSVSYTIDSGSLPNGVSLQSIDATTAVISGVPTQEGNFTVGIKGVNADAETSTATVTIVVLPEGSITPITREKLIELLKKWENNPTEENAYEIINADTSEITNMSGLFCSDVEFCPYYLGEDYIEYNGNLAWEFNLDISGWDVSSVTNMRGMFRMTHVFKQDISNWDVSSVTDMSGMFSFAYVFNQDIGSWDVSSVTDSSDFAIYSGLETQNMPTFP